MGFKEDFAKMMQRAAGREDAFVRSTFIALGSSIVLKTPVGDPSTWKNPPPAGYIGGRLRGNWQFGEGQPNQSVDSPIDKTGAGSIGRISIGANSFVRGRKMFITNSMPYAKRIEYDAWSNQATAGMVRMSVLEFNSMVRATAATL